MNETIFTYFIILIIIIIVISNLFFSKKAVIKRKLKRAHFVKISNFSSGEVAKIIGNVELVEKPLISPLSNRECSYYYVHVEQKVSAGKSSRWSTLIEEEDSCKFVIKSDSHYAFIDDKNLKSYIVHDREYSSGFLEDATEVLERYLQTHGFKSENFLGFNKTIRYTEGILEKGEQIAVFGKGEWKDADQFQLPEYYNRILVITSAENENVYLSDDPDTTKNQKE